MTPLTRVIRIPLKGEGCVLAEDLTATGVEGTVRADPIGDALPDLPRSLEGSLEPVATAARDALDQPHEAHPNEITVEFGIGPAVEAGAVITKGRATGHLKGTVSWKRDRPGGQP
ncbi:CU044_2847 family protein [Streptomyces sp. NPDC096132]|uniref:CU044_2847 family protein n=1 Tax=Streptomyces sp. NPDC096132 TaxID=3366075 RepID=UPI00381A95B3